MRYLVLVLTVILVPDFSSGQPTKRFYFGNKVTVKYFVKGGMLNGKYESCYKNGKLKAKGSFKNNGRIGEWVVYDSTGKVLTKREYKNNLQFTRIAPTDSASQPDSTYIIERNAEGYYNYAHLDEKKISWSYRTWSYFFNSENAILGESNRLFKVIYSQAIEHNIKVFKYHGYDIDNSFLDTVDFKPTSIDTSAIQVIGFFTKEDWYYDKEREQMDCRILGICPVAINKVNRDTVNLFWIYYPQLRKYLAKEKVNASLDSHVENMDDVFFWRFLRLQSIFGVMRTPKNADLIIKMYDFETDDWVGKYHELDW